MADLNMDRVAKVLSSSMVVSSSEFGKLTPSNQTEVLTSSDGKPIVFVDDFATLRNYRRIAEMILTGSNVNMELEFNNIELTDDEHKAIEAVRPVLERIRSLAPKYPFADVPEDAVFITMKGETQVTNGSYTTSVAGAKRVWDKVKGYWAGNVKRSPARSYELIPGNGHNYISYHANRVELGCQTVQRYQVEQLAKELGWEFPEVK